MKITFLGTGTSQGVPVIACNCEVCQSADPKDKRLRSSVLIETQGKTFVIDTGPDFRQQMLRQQVQQLDAVLFTHEHKDHIAGLDDVRAFNYRQQKPMPVYGNKQVLEALKREFAYAFAKKKYPGVPAIILHQIKKGNIWVEGIEFTAIETLHYKLPILCYRIQDFVYITDTNYISATEKEKLKNAKVLVVNALRQSEHVSHYNLKQALELIDELKPEKAYLTHVSHLMGKTADVSKQLPDNVEFAFDGLSVFLK